MPKNSSMSGEMSEWGAELRPAGLRLMGRGVFGKLARPGGCAAGGLRGRGGKGVLRGRRLEGGAGARGAGGALNRSVVLGEGGKGEGGAGRGVSRLARGFGWGGGLGGWGWCGGRRWGRRSRGLGGCRGDFDVLYEEMAAAGAPMEAVAVTHIIAETIRRVGTAGQRERILRPVTRGEVLLALGYSEPDAGSDLASARTTTRRFSPGSAGWPPPPRPPGCLARGPRSGARR